MSDVDLILHYFVGCQLKFSTFNCLLSVNLSYFLSLVGIFFPRFVGSQ